MIETQVWREAFCLSWILETRAEVLREGFVSEVDYRGGGGSRRRGREHTSGSTGNYYRFLVNYRLSKGVHRELTKTMSRDLGPGHTT